MIIRQDLKIELILSINAVMFLIVIAQVSQPNIPYTKTLDLKRIKIIHRYVVSFKLRVAGDKFLHSDLNDG